MFAPQGTTPTRRPANRIERVRNQPGAVGKRCEAPLNASGVTAERAPGSGYSSLGAFISSALRGGIWTDVTKKRTWSQQPVKNSGIEWTHHTFNPWRGCQHATAAGQPHPGCDHCYAEKLAKINPGALGVWGSGGTRVLASDAQWDAVKHWNDEAATAGRRDRVFCASLADVFEAWAGPISTASGDVWIKPPHVSQHGFKHWETCDADTMKRDSQCQLDSQCWLYVTLDDVRERLFALIDATPALDWLLLTKRPANIRKLWPLMLTGIAPNAVSREPKHNNVWLGVSVSDQATANDLIPALLECRSLCQRLFLSAEPLLGPIDLRRVCRDWMSIDALAGACQSAVSRPQGGGGRCGSHPKLDWVIVGGESGPKARPMRPEWVRSIRDQCIATDTKFFFKQWGEWAPSENSAVDDDAREAGYVSWGSLPQGLRPAIRVGKKAAGRLLDGREWNEFPQ